MRDPDEPSNTTPATPSGPDAPKEPPPFAPDLDLIGDMQKSENGPRETR